MFYPLFNTWKTVFMKAFVRSRPLFHIEIETNSTSLLSFIGRGLISLNNVPFPWRSLIFFLLDHNDRSVVNSRLIDEDVIIKTLDVIIFKKKSFRLLF